MLSIIFKTKSNRREETRNKNSKRKRKEQTSTIVMEQASTCTIVNEGAIQMTSSLQQTPCTNQSESQIALKPANSKAK